MRQFAILLASFALGIVAAADIPPDPAWHADAVALRQRVEHLAAVGALDAAQGVLGELRERPGSAGGHADRAAFALARALVAAGKPEEALALVAGVTWTDKQPKVAADIVALRLAIHWQGALDKQGRLRSGLVLPHEVIGTPEDFQRRQMHRESLSKLERGGVAMLAAEGSQARLPVSAAWLAGLQWAAGDAAAQPAVGDDVQLALALGQVAVEEHEIDTALIWADYLEQHDRAATESLLTELALWRERRETLRGVLALWDGTTIETRLQKLLTAHPQALARARQVVSHETDLHGISVGTAASRLSEPQEISVEAESDGVLFGARYQDADEVMLALDHHHLRCTPNNTFITTAEIPTVTLQSAYAGVHRVAYWRLPDMAAYRTWCANPQRDLLGVAPDGIEEITTTRARGSNDIVTSTHTLGKTLPEGLYALTTMVRGAPVVAVSAFMVSDIDVQILGSRDGVLAWVVDRRTGTHVTGADVLVTFTRSISPEYAAGARWNNADAAWRDGFSAGFLGDAFLGRLQGDADQVAAGRRAGAEEAQHTVREIELRGTSDGQGLVIFPSPSAWTGGWSAEAAVGRAGVAVAAKTKQGQELGASLRFAAWADVPFARPGETVHWRALLRRFDGDRFALPENGLGVRLILDPGTARAQVLSSVTVNPTADGACVGSVVIPPDVEEGWCSIEINGYTQQLCRIGRSGLPEVTLDMVGPHDDIVQAGGAALVRVKIMDAQGQALAEHAVRWSVAAEVGGISVPVTPTAEEASNAEGWASVSVPTVSDNPGTYVVTARVEQNGKAYQRRITFSARIMPFPLTVHLVDSRCFPGGSVRAQIWLPAEASVACSLIIDGSSGDTTVRLSGMKSGKEPGNIQLQTIELPVPATARNSVILRCSAGGKWLDYPLQLQVRAEQRSDVDLVLTRRFVDPGEPLDMQVRVSRPGIDALVFGSAQALHEYQCVATTAAATPLQLTVKPAWVPNLYLRALAYLPGRGFISSPPADVRVRPIDRLLTVTAQIDADDWHPGRLADVTMQVRNWQGESVAQAHLSIGVVNERLYDITDDSTPDLWRYFHEQQRADSSSLGSAISRPTLNDVLWRAVIWRHGCGNIGGIGYEFGSRSSGGKGRSMGAYGGSAPFLAIHDAVIFWQGDVVTDAQGNATVRVQLPDTPGAWRLTARANDASAAVLVGELRQRLVSEAALHAALTLPATAMAGDLCPAMLHFHNRSLLGMTVQTTVDSHLQEVKIESQRRQSRPLTFIVPKGAGPILERDGVLGQLAEIRWEVQGVDLNHHEHKAVAKGVLFVPLPGIAQHWQRQVLVGPDGVVPVGIAIAPGAGISCTIRAWGGGRERAQAWIAEHVQRGDDVQQILALLLDKRDFRVDARLPQRWAALGSGPMDRLCRQLAWVQGSISVLDEPADGDYLARRARFLQGLPSQRPSGSTAEAIAGRRLQLAEGTAWKQAVARVLDGHDAVALAILTDAAVLTKDDEASRLLAALSVAEWTEPMVEAIAVIHLKETNPSADAAVVIHADTDTKLASGSWQAWTGMATADWRLQARPGAVVEVSLIVQQELPLPILAAQWYQFENDGWWPVAADALRPLYPTVLRVAIPDNTEASLVNLAEVHLPPTLEPVAVPAAPNGDQRQVYWLRDPEQVLPAGLRDGDRAAITTLLSAWYREMRPSGALVSARTWNDLGASGIIATVSTVSAVSAEDENTDAARKRNRPALPSGRFIEFGFRTRAAGSGLCQVVLRDADGHAWAQVRIPTTVQAGDAVMEATVRALHPQAATIQAFLPALDAAERIWLGQRLQALHDEKDIAHLVAAAGGVEPYTLAEALGHPHRSQSGHAARRRLEMWRTDPLAGGIDETLAVAGVSLSTPITLTEVSTLRDAIEVVLPRVDIELGLPQTVLALPNLRELAKILRKNEPTDTDAIDAWLWNQELSSDLANHFRITDLASWRKFLNEQCGLRMALPTEPVRCDQQDVLGAGLGRVNLMAAGLLVVRAGEGYGLQILRPQRNGQMLVTVDFVDANMVDVIAWLDATSRTAGGLSVSCPDAQNLTDPITLRATDMQFSEVLRHVGLITNQQVTLTPAGYLLE